MAAKKQAATAVATETQDESAGILDDILSRMPKTVEKDRGRDMVETLVKGVLSNTVTFDRSLTATINKAIEDIDEKLSKQLSAIMHNKDFQQLEGSWRGLNYLVKNSETGADLQIRMLNASKKELHRDLSRALEFDQSELWKTLYEGAFGQAGADPYGLLVGDFEFGNDNMDIELLSKMSGVAAGSMAPFLSAAGPGMFGLESYTEMSQIRDLATTFDDDVLYTKWNSFRDSEDSKYCVLTCPRVLSREPYGSSNTRIDEFNFEEHALSDDGMRTGEVDHDNYAWMNSAFALAGRMTAAFSKSGWCTAIRGYENGGRVEDLPIHTFRTADGDHANKCPTEILISDTREKELSDLGFLPLVNYKNTDDAVFFGAQTVHRPKNFGKKDYEAKANAEISARLPYVMASSRIAHYLKCIARDKIGSFAERGDLETFLKKWISQYVLDAQNATPEQKAKFPLAAAEVAVEAVPGKPGSYNAIAHLRPWLQMETLSASLRMVAELPDKSK